MKLWYRQPAQEWLQALPIGNGHIGAMVFGGVNQEHIQLNEETLWAGKSIDRNNPDASKYLQEIRKLLFAGRHIEAEKLALKYLISFPCSVRPYQPLGDLWINFGSYKKISDYRRELELETGTVFVNYNIKGVRFTREVFTSAPDRILVVHMKADRSYKFNVSMEITSKLAASGGVLNRDGLILRGQIVDLPKSNMGKGDYNLKFEVRAKVLLKHGKFLQKGDKNWKDDGKIYISGTNSFTLVLSAATDFYGRNPAEVCQERLMNAAKKTFTILRNTANKDQARLFSKVNLNFGKDDKHLVPTDKRQQNVMNGKRDPNLDALYFQFGRYILISCSRPGGLPANLQGIWNDKLKPPWNSNYTTNINLQMNYWLAEVANLAECHGPLLDFISELRKTGKLTAKKTYNCSGWVAHHNSDAWASSTPFNGLEGIWPMGGAWLAMHLWEHYDYSRDKKFLREKAYPIMKGAAGFILDFLVKNDKGQLITNPSVSPENTFKTAKGQTAWLCVGATMDFEIIYDLFTHCIEAGKILNLDKTFCLKLRDVLQKLPPLKIGKHGYLQEWLEDYNEVEPGHRHMSHLYAFFPGSQIVLRKTPELAKAVETVLKRRFACGGGGMNSHNFQTAAGWSNVWASLLWARLEKPEKAYWHIQNHTVYSSANLFSKAHTVFQIDATLGITAAIAEMLLQSHAGEISLLPALPEEWYEGEVTGLRARGGYTINMTWRKGFLKKATIHSAFKGFCRVRFRGDGQIVINKGNIRAEFIEPNLIEFPTRMNTGYKLEFN